MARYAGDAAVRVSGIVVVAPSATYHPWNAALREGALAVGYEVVSQNDLETMGGSGKPVLLVTHDPGLTLGVARDWTTAVPGDVASAAAQCSALFATSPRDGLSIATRILANMSVLPTNTIYIRERSEEPTADIGPNIRISRPTTRQDWSATDLDSDIREALRLYEDLPGTGADRVEWRPSLFLFDQNRENDLERGAMIDLTGRSRALVYGPYIGLRPGRWSITARFMVDDEAAKHRFRFEWGPSSNLHGINRSPLESGEYEVTLVQDWTEPTAAEFRILLQQGSLGGFFQFLGATIVRIGDLAAEESGVVSPVIG